MDYIKLFDLISDYNNYIKSEDALLPNVSLILETTKLHYNPIKKQISYFGFTAIEDTTIIITARNSGEICDPIANLEYSKDGDTWTTWDYSNIQLLAGESVYLKGNNPNGFSSFSDDDLISHNFAMSTGKYNVHGNIMSLIYGDDFEDKYTIPTQYCFYALFHTMSANPNTSLVNAGDLILPATTLTDNCYYAMFTYCTSLLSAPALPATTLANGCYVTMFGGCTSLVTAPVLPAGTLAGYCYLNIFAGCTNLNNITMLATDISADNCLTDWVSDVSSTGTFTKHKDMTSLQSGTSGIPAGWTVVDYAA